MYHGCCRIGFTDMTNSDDPVVTVELWFEVVLIGEISDVREHQGTMFGIFAGQHTEWNDLPLVRLMEYARFCRTWYEKACQPNGADPEEFNAFQDIVKPGRWTTVDELGIRRTVSDAPMFMQGWKGEVTWSYEDEV